LFTASCAATKAPVIAAVRVPLAQLLEVEHRAQRAADQALDLLRAAALLAARGLAVAAGVGGARQHAVFGRHPALAAAPLVRRHPVFDRGGAQDARVAELDEHGALGMDGEAARDAHRTELVGGAAAGALEGHGEGETGKTELCTAQDARAAARGFVIPVRTGIQAHRMSFPRRRESRRAARAFWAPACAGVTAGAECELATAGAARER
jgi:hypothetical protein